VAESVVALAIAAFIVVLGSSTAVMAAGSEAIVLEGPGLERPIEVDFRTRDLDQFELAAQLGARFNSRAGDVGPLLAEAPTDDLGPRWTVTWIAGGPAGASREDRSTPQEVYPHAAGGPLVYTPPAEHLVGANVGWYQAPSEVRHTLRALGVPLRSDTSSNSATRTFVVVVGCLLSVLVSWRLAVSRNRRRRSAVPRA
jgi:hypothetical protein